MGQFSHVQKYLEKKEGEILIEKEEHRLVKLIPITDLTNRRRCVVWFCFFSISLEEKNICATCMILLQQNILCWQPSSFSNSLLVPWYWCPACSKAPMLFSFSFSHLHPYIYIYIYGSGSYTSKQVWCFAYLVTCLIYVH